MKTMAIQKAVAMVVLGLLATSVMAIAADLKQNTVSAFDKYVAATERRMSLEVDPGGQFLYVDSLPASEMASAYERLRHGEILVELMKTTASGVDYEIPEGVVHHWVGVVFISGATLEQTRAVAQDYDHRAQLYQPEVIAAHVISHEGDDYRIFMRLYEKRFTTVVFNTEYAIHWGQVDERTMYSNSMSTRIAEVKDPNNPEGPDLPVGTGNGYLWRLNTYWRFQEKDGGVYIQCEAVSLTRDIPFGLGWLLRPLVTKIPKQSLTRTLGRTREVVLERK